MKISLLRVRLLAGLMVVSAAASSASASSAQDVARAAAIVQRVVELNTRFAAYEIELEAPAPIAGSTGKYMIPIDANGALTGWAQKALSAQAGNIAGEQAGAAATRGLASVVPGGGLAGGLLKKKGKEAGATLALGGLDYIRATSSFSFNSPADYAVFLHAKAGRSAEYSKAVQAAIALYPDLEKSYSASVSAAYEAALKRKNAAAK